MSISNCKKAFVMTEGVAELSSGLIEGLLQHLKERRKKKEETDRLFLLSGRVITLNF
ncbi:MAG: hypothetical protein U0V48_15030 [Anaerolineales bacterium]